MQFLSINDDSLLKYFLSLISNNYDTKLITQAFNEFINLIFKSLIFIDSYPLNFNFDVFNPTIENEENELENLNLIAKTLPTDLFLNLLNDIKQNSMNLNQLDCLMKTFQYTSITKNLILELVKSSYLHKIYNIDYFSQIPISLSHLFISHAHYDHIPPFLNYINFANNSESHDFNWIKFQNDINLISNPLSIEMIKIRLNAPNLQLKPKTEGKISLNLNDCNWFFKIVPSGHTLDSSALAINSSSDFENNDKIDILYAPEFRTENVFSHAPIFYKYFNPLKPVHCETFITEFPFNNKSLIFPPLNLEYQKLKDLIEDSLNKNPLIIYAYDYGKAQEISLFLHQYEFDQNFPVIFEQEAFKINQYLISNNFPLSKQYTKINARKENLYNKFFILITNHFNKSDNTILKLKQTKNAKECEVSGWCADPQWKKDNPANYYFIISDHLDWNSLIEFAKKCKPTKLLVKFKGTFQDFSYLI